MAGQEAGWRNDPYGRFQQRYYNGTAWTEHVATGGEQQVDPLGASTVIPIATPPTAFASGDGEGAGVVKFLEGAGPDSRERPAPSLRTAVAGLGGAVLAAGVFAVTSVDDPSQTRIALVAFLIMAAALASRLFVKVAEVQAAAVGMAVVSIPAFASAVTVSDGSSSFWTGLLTAALFIAAWALPGFKSRNLLLALGAIALVSAFGSLIDSGSSEFVPSALSDNLGNEGVVYLVGGALYLGLTLWLDRRGHRGTGTAFAAAGVLSTLIGTSLLVNDFGESSAPIFVLIVGLVVAFVGSQGARRATTWWGAVLTAIAAVWFVAIQWEPDTNTAIGGVLIVAGVALVAIPLIATPLQAAMKAAKPDQTPPPPTAAA